MATDADIKKQEQVAGRKAAKMAQEYVRAAIRQNVNVRGKGSGKQKPLLQATTVKAKMGDHRLLGLNLNSSKVGFILHHGFVGVREASKVYLRAARYQVKYTQRKRHPLNLPQEDFFSDIYTKSGALDYLVKELSETRTGAFQLRLDSIIHEFNKTTDGE